MTNTIKDQSYWIKKFNAVESTKYPNRWDVKGSAYLSSENLTKLPLSFGIVSGHFYCDYNQLKTLEGTPIEVGGNFYCNNNQLTSLEGCPIEVGRDFSCFSNQLETLKGLPTHIGGDLFFEDNPLEHLNDLMNIEIKGEICVDNITLIKALQNTNLDVLEYSIEKHKYWFVNDKKKKKFQMYLEQIVIKKRLENILV